MVNKFPEMSDITMAIQIHSQDLNNLRNLMRDINRLIITRPPGELISPIVAQYQPTDKAADFVREFSDYFQKSLKRGEEHAKNPQVTHEPPIKFDWQDKYPKKFGEMLFPIILSVYRFIMEPDIFFDMTLTHTITLFEDFLNDFFKFVFLINSDCLKSEKTLTYEEILSFKSIEDLKEHLAYDTADNLLDENIDDLAKSVKQRFSIDLLHSKDFMIIREASYRRNIIVHNRSTVDRTYHYRIPTSKIGTRLHTSFLYMETLFVSVGNFIDFLDDRFSTKLKYKRKPVFNALLNPPDSPDIGNP